MRRNRVRDQGNRAHGPLHGVQQRESGEHSRGHQLFVRLERVPRLDIVGERNLFGQPKVSGEPVPYFLVFFVDDFVPVDRLH